MSSAAFPGSSIPDPPARVRPYPPLGGLVGAAFLTWLFGALTLGCFTGPARNAVLGVVFALPALLFFFLAWTYLMDILLMGRTGIFLSASGIRFVDSGFFGPSVRELTWRDVEKVNLEGSTLRFFTRRESDALTIRMEGYLEEPSWVADRAAALLKRASDPGARLPEEQIGDLQSELDSATCTHCGGSIDVPLDNSPVRCGYCGTTQGLPLRVGQALARISEVLVRLPAVHRQIQGNLSMKWVSQGARRSRTLVLVGWGTAVVWLVFAGVSVASESARLGRFSIDKPFLVLTVAMSLFSILTGHLLAMFTRRVSREWTIPNLAVEPAVPGGAVRCRSCGAPLTAAGLVRRCDYCGTDSLVTGTRLASAERSARRLLVEARRQATQATQGAVRLLGRVANALEGFAWAQFFWLHLPIIVALEGYPGMLLRLTTVCAAAAAGTVTAGFIGMAWLRREKAPEP
ncbi:MAG: hypothetical protein KA419_19050 [Acidobacteria bacterium]|nr:hypothetical protein [Acidobacteriota bacterium]